MKQVLAAICGMFPDLAASEFRGQTRLVAPRTQLFAVLQTLKEKLDFDMLVDVTCVDYLDYPGGTVPSFALAKMGLSPLTRGVSDGTGRFGLVYLLANLQTNQRIAVRCFVNDPEPVVPTVVPLWEGANWLEREVWDMFGIHFEGHPDLRRILLPEEFTAHPLRKDYPLQGRGERHNFLVIHRAES